MTVVIMVIVVIVTMVMTAMVFGCCLVTSGPSDDIGDGD